MEELESQAAPREEKGEGASGLRYNYDIPYYYSHEPGNDITHKALARSARDIVMAAQVADANIIMAGCGPKSYLHRLVDLHRRVEGTIRLMAEAFDAQGPVDRAAEEIRAHEAEYPKELVDPEKGDDGLGVKDALVLGLLAEIIGDKS